MIVYQIGFTTKHQVKTYSGEMVNHYTTRTIHLLAADFAEVSSEVLKLLGQVLSFKKSDYGENSATNEATIVSIQSVAEKGDIVRW